MVSRSYQFILGFPIPHTRLYQNYPSKTKACHSEFTPLGQVLSRNPKSFYNGFPIGTFGNDNFQSLDYWTD
jgi:hypothetical protein